uniref:Uncharacterized protein n=1 Tax=Romanomermis culicivorax TaxID=13658 RepID=A0A915KE86_ROMCU
MLCDLKTQIIQKRQDSTAIFDQLGIMPQVQGLKGLASEFLGVDPTPFILNFSSYQVKNELLAPTVPKRLELYAALDSCLMLNLFFAMLHFHLCGDIQDLFLTFAHDYQAASSIAYNADQIQEHLFDKAVRDTDLDMYNIPANKLPFSSRATFYMWQEATKRYMCHIDQEAACWHCSYRKINHDIVLRVDPFPPKFRNHVIVNRADKPKPSVQNPKKTREEWEEEEYEQYSIAEDIQRRTETDPDLIREYEALGGYLWSDPSDAEPTTAQPSYATHFTRNNPLQDPVMFIEDIRSNHLKLFPYVFDLINHPNLSRIAKDISPILYYFWPSTFEEGRKFKAKFNST